MPIDYGKMNQMIHEKLMGLSGPAPSYSTDDSYCDEIVKALKKKGALVIEGTTNSGHYYLNVSGGRLQSTQPMSRSKADAYAFAAARALGFVHECIGGK